MPDITVITPSIPHRGELLARAVQSVERQTLKPDAHLIMIDVLGEGAPKMLDRLLLAAQTEWVAILADDDEFLPHHLEVLYNLAIDTAADLAFSHFRFDPGTDGGHLEQWRGVPFDNANPRQITGVFLVKRDLALKVGGFSGGFDVTSFDKDEQGHRIGEDFIFVKKLAAAGARFANSAEVTWIYHIGHGNTLGMPDRRPHDS